MQREARRMDGSVIYVLDGKQRFRAGYLQRQVGKLLPGSVCGRKDVEESTERISAAEPRGHVLSCHHTNHKEEHCVAAPAFAD